MALQITLKGQGNADVNYHLINGGNLQKNLNDNSYRVKFGLVSFVDKATRDDHPELGSLDSRAYVKNISEEQMAHIIDYLDLYDHAKENQAVGRNEGLVFANAIDV